ncbi:MAG: hypothetical protein AAGC68_08660 [Verrucomicrobiota bacterium]
MKLTPYLFAICATASFLSGPSSLMAQERATISSSKTSNGKITRKAFFTNEKRSKVRPVERVKLNTQVYKHEGKITVNHDTASSPEVIFHLRDGKVVPGHAFDE